MSDRTLEQVLSSLPREAWEPEDPPPFAVPVRERPRRRGVVLRPALAGGLAVLLLAIGLFAGLALDRDSSLGGRAVALRPVTGADPSSRATVHVAARSVEVDVGHLRPSRSGDFYEVWLLTPPGKLIALGSFRVPESGSTSVRLPLPTDPRGYGLFDVSVEPGDGNPAHSGRSVLQAPTS